MCLCKPYLIASQVHNAALIQSRTMAGLILGLTCLMRRSALTTARLPSLSPLLLLGKARSVKCALRATFDLYPLMQAVNSAWLDTDLCRDYRAPVIHPVQSLLLWYNLSPPLSKLVYLPTRGRQVRSYSGELSLRNLQSWLPRADSSLLVYT